jgi:hypothetical protein
MTIEILEETQNATSAQSESSESQDLGNVSVAEFADQLLKRRQTEEVVAESTESEDEPAEETAEPTESLEEQPVEETEAPEETTEQAQPQDVLTKYGIDLDSLSEEESKELAKALNTSAVKRFGVLTSQKKALQAQNAELQAQAQQAQQPVSNDLPDFLKDNALHNVADVNALMKEVENLNTLIEWADEGLDNEVQYDDNGNEYMVKDGDKTYTKAELKRIQKNAKKILRKDAPAREKWIKERSQSDQQAIQTFQFLGEPESDDYKLFMQVKASPLYRPLVEYLPNSNFALGLMVEGMKAVQSRQAQASKPKPKPKTPVASVEAGSSRPKTSQAKKNKEVDAAKRKFNASGSMADYQNYLKIKNQS